VAHKLYDKLVERMVEAGARYLIADTDPSNAAALKFFTKKGFKDEREHVVLSLNLSRTERYRTIMEKFGNGHGESEPRAKKPRRPKTAAGKNQEKPLCGATALDPER
jgi:hypothetical protein